MMNRPRTWRRNSLDVSNSTRDDFGADESVAGIAGDTSVGMSKHSTTDGSLLQKPPSKSDMSYYENDSVMLWSDDPEKQYFDYILQREQENRAKKGKSAEDSLIGDSTLEEIQQEFSKWHQNGGQEDSDQEASFKYSLPPMSQHSNLPYNNSRQHLPNRPNLDGFSLATEEKSYRKEGVRVDIPDKKPTPKDISKMFPDVIYVTDTPATSVSLSKRSKGSSLSEGRGRMCFVFSLLLMGFTCLAAAGVGIYVSMRSNNDQDGKNPAQVVSNADNTTEGNGPAGQTERTSVPTVSPSREPFVIMEPPVSDDLALGKATPEPTPDPTILLTMEPTASPVLLLTSPSANPTSTTDSPSTPPTQFPTRVPTNKPTTSSSPPPSEAYCGCQNCEAALNRMANGYSCQERMNFLRYERGHSELGACRLVAGIEFPMICGLCNPDECEDPARAVEVPPLTTPRPSLRPTNAPQMPDTPGILAVSMRGNNGRPTDAFPLGECEGDCDNDDDCGQGLVCFQRSSGDAVPGCLDGDQETSEMDVCIAG